MHVARWTLTSADTVRSFTHSITMMSTNIATVTTKIDVLELSPVASDPKEPDVAVPGGTGAVVEGVSVSLGV